MPTLAITCVSDDACPNTLTFQDTARQEVIGQLAAWTRERIDWSNDEAPARPSKDQELWFYPLQAQVASGALIESAFTDADEEFANEEHEVMPLRRTLTRAKHKIEALAIDTYAEMVTRLDQQAAEQLIPNTVEVDRPFRRVYVRRRPEGNESYPQVEHLLKVAPATVEDKSRTQFIAPWAIATNPYHQQAMF